MKQTVEQLRLELMDLVSYDPDTGIFRWEKAIQYRKIGDRAGSQRPDGYWRIQLNGREYLQHRLAWLFVYGEWPTTGLDHEDRDPSNNRIKNLRLATQVQNLQNAKTRSDSRTGMRGVRWHDGAFVARIKIGAERVTLGRFKTLTEAAEVYLSAARAKWGEFFNPQQNQNAQPKK